MRSSLAPLLMSLMPLGASITDELADGVFGFAALGGSNTLGAKHSIPGKGGHGSWTSFARLTYLSLRAANRTDAYHSGAIGAMGPTLSAACTGRFIPLDSRYVTIEYMPNMGCARRAHSASAHAHLSHPCWCPHRHR